MLNSEDRRGFYFIAGSSVAVTAACLTLISAPFLIVPAIHNLPWMGTPRNISRKAFKQLRVLHHAKNPTERIRVLDLGSGDGMVCIEAAKLGYDATGYEVDS
jgi:hypothetical protein